MFEHRLCCSPQLDHTVQTLLESRVSMTESEKSHITIDVAVQALDSTYDVMETGTLGPA